MALYKFISFVAVAALVMQSTYSASIGNDCICTLNYDPLCGSDGNTYGNECELSCAKKLNRNLEIFSKGECVEVQNLPVNEEVSLCACPFILDPVCGSDGQTYSNECEIGCAKKLNRNLEIFKKGECVEIQNLPVAAKIAEIENLPANLEEPTCICHANYDPMCGSDGNTYGNECMLKCAKKLNRNLEIFSKGECVKTSPAHDEFPVCVCPLILNPVCGSDGQTYSNECILNCEKRLNRNLEVYAQGECIKIQNLPAAAKIAEIQNLPANLEEPTCICHANYDPMCGSDGNTYGNECMLKCAKKLNRNLEIFSRGECVEALPAHEELPICACPFILDPVCGSDGQTYSNECEIGCAKQLNRNLEIFKKGECVEIQNLPSAAKVADIHNLPAAMEEPMCICNAMYDPMCGSDGNTYGNACMLKCAKKLNRNLEIFSRGECVKTLPAHDEFPVCACPLILNPVCGSDGQTYSNECSLNCAKKLNRNLEVYKHGECINVQNLPLTKF